MKPRMERRLALLTTQLLGPLAAQQSRKPNSAAFAAFAYGSKLRAAPFETRSQAFEN